MKPHDFYELESRIETPRLWLRPMQKEDARRVVDWRNEASTAAMFFSEPPTLSEHRKWFDGPRQGRIDYMIVRKDVERPIGVVNFKNIDETRGNAEAGKLLGDLESRGRGMAKESFAAWILYGMGPLGLNEVMVRTREDNTANIHLNRRLGFEVENHYRQEAADGVVRTFITMVLGRRAVEGHDYFRTIDRQGFFDSTEGGMSPGRRR